MAQLWRDFVVQLKHDMTTGAQGGDSLGGAARQLLPRLQRNLLDLPEYQSLVEKAQTGRRSAGHCQTTEVYQDDNVHAALLTVFRDNPLPFHDHPDSTGMMLMISGSTRIMHCRVISENSESGITDLKVIRERERTEGQVCWFHTNEGNVHGLEALSPQSVLLVVHIPPYRKERQSYYFPIVAQLEEGDNFAAQRIAVGAIKKKMQNK